jgi:hypothetical protein
MAFSALSLFESNRLQQETRKSTFSLVYAAFSQLVHNLYVAGHSVKFAW